MSVIVEPLITAQEIAALVRVNASTISAWAHKKLIPSIKINSRVTRYRAADVLAALQKPATADTKAGAA